MNTRDCYDGGCGACNSCRYRDTMAVMQSIHTDTAQDLALAREHIIQLRLAMEQLYEEAKDTDLSMTTIRLVEKVMRETNWFEDDKS